MTLKFDNVHTATWASPSLIGPGRLCFGDLQRMGHLTKRYVPESRYDPDNFTIVWTVVGDIEFTTDRGETFKQGDVIEWPK